jgi:hypothetical protein
MEEAALNKKNLFSSKLEFNLRNKLAKCYIWIYLSVMTKYGS